MEPRDADLGSLLSVNLGSWGGRLPAAAKRRKNRTLYSGRPVLTKRLPPSVLVVRRDLRGCQCPKSLNKTHTSRRTASTERGNLLHKTGLALQRGAIFDVLFRSQPSDGNRGCAGVGGMGGAGMTWGPRFLTSMFHSSSSRPPNIRFQTPCDTLQAKVCGGLPTLREYRRTFSI